MGFDLERKEKPKKTSKKKPVAEEFSDITESSKPLDPTSNKIKGEASNGSSLKDKSKISDKVQKNPENSSRSSSVERKNPDRSSRSSSAKPATKNNVESKRKSSRELKGLLEWTVQSQSPQKSTAKTKRN